jgi:hypothetical protein
MSEFNNRIGAQRDILLVINNRDQNEELFGLSAGAIDRWAAANSLRADSHLVQLVRQAATKLFFLSNKSQEQITQEYRLLSAEVSSLREKIAEALSEKLA